MSEMIERVAKALFAYENRELEKQYPGSGWDGPLFEESGRKMYREMAQTALAAITEKAIENFFLASGN